MIRALSAEWNELLKSEFDQPYFNALSTEVNAAYRAGKVFPPASEVFSAFNLCHFSELKIVIIGQDPYHAAGQAHGLCFSVNHGVAIPPSLRNIFTELRNDVSGFQPPSHGNLQAWARQGVLLLNAVMTVAEGKPGSHRALGWEKFTDAVISLISARKQNVVFMLWGNYAIAKAALIDEAKHLVLKAAHPSPLARGAFFGCRHFSRANAYLVSHGVRPVNWDL